MLIRFLFGAILYCSVASFALGQQTTGALKGTVTDQLGSLVVGAKVTLRNARGVSSTANTNSAGVYEFRRLGTVSRFSRNQAPTSGTAGSLSTSPTRV